MRRRWGERHNIREEKAITVNPPAAAKGALLHSTLIRIFSFLGFWWLVRVTLVVA